MSLLPAARPAERIGFTAASAAALALLGYALLQIASQHGALRAPAHSIPLFWRLEWAVLAAGLGAPGLWHLSRAQDPAQRARLLSTLLLAAVGAIVGCAELCP